MGGLAISQLRELDLTRRQHQCEYEITFNTNAKMVLSNEQLNLSRQYRARLKGNDITYYSNGQYNKMTYNYVMGSGISTYNTLVNNPSNIKSDMSMVLTDAGGLVVMNSQYANAIKKVLGNDCIRGGKGGTFSVDKVPAIIAAVAGFPVTEEKVKTVINGGTIDSDWEGSSSIKNAKTLETTGTNSTKDNSDTATEIIKKIVDFFYPIFQAAAANGWTTKFNNEIEHNSDYISDALVSGTLRLEQVESDGNYWPNSSLTYFTMAGVGGVAEKSDASHREEVTAWYNEKKSEIDRKEQMYDLTITELDAELQAIKTELESVKSLIKDEMSIFNWGNA